MKDIEDIVSVLFHCLKSHLMLAMTRAQRMRYNSGMTWYNRSLSRATGKLRMGTAGLW